MNVKAAIDVRSVEEQLNVTFKKVIFHKHTNGFLSITLDWSTIDSTYKYVKLDHTLSGSNWIDAVGLMFADADEDAPWFIVGLSVDNDDDFFKPENQFDFVKIDNTKYGVVVWFGPRGWEDWDNATVINN